MSLLERFGRPRPEPPEPVWDRDVTFPVIFVTDGEALVCADLRTVFGGLEPEYWDRASYEAFDRAGNLLDVVRDGREWTVVVVDRSPVYAVQLRLRLIECLAWRDLSPGEHYFAMSVDELIERAIAEFGPKWNT